MTIDDIFILSLWWIALSLIPAYIAKRMGRTSIYWYYISIAISPLIATVVLMYTLPPRGESVQRYDWTDHTGRVPKTIGCLGILISLAALGYFQYKLLMIPVVIFVAIFAWGLVYRWLMDRYAR